jgi:glycosyltransferase involved in cell wall biosynthesis
MIGRVCQVISTLRTGGMEKMVCDLMAGLATRGVESVVFCTDAEGELYEAVPAVAKACGHRAPGLFVIDWRLLSEMVRFVKAERVVLLHAHNHAPNLYCVLVSLLTGIPVVVTRHGQGYKTWRWKLLTRLLALRARQIVLVSEDAMRVAVANHSVSVKKAMVIPNGVDTERFRPKNPESSIQNPASIASTTEQPDNSTPLLRTRLGIPSDALVIGSVGRLSPEKNYPLLLRALASLVCGKPPDPTKREAPGGRTSREPAKITDPTKREAPGGRTSCEPSCVHGSGQPRPPEDVLRFKLFLLLVGDGADRRRIEAEIARLNLKDHCHITGMQSEVRSWLRLMDVFCLSSDTEGLSISLLEAGACGLASVVTDAGGNREIVRDGVSGLVVPRGDEAAMAGALDRLAGDVVLRGAMGAAARKIVEKQFSLDAMIDGYMKVYGKASR